MEKIGEPKFGGIRGQPGEGGSGGEGRSHATDEVVFFSDAGGGMRQSPQEAARRRRRWRRLKNGGALKPQSQVTGVPRLISFHFSLSYSELSSSPSATGCFTTTLRLISETKRSYVASLVSQNSVDLLYSVSRQKRLTS